MTWIISLVTGTVGRYLLIGAIGFLVLAWFRHDAVAPYKSQITELRRAAAQRDAIIEADAERQLNDLAQKSRLEERLHEILSNQTDACKLSDADISRLQQLAGDG